jgi:uncharacterized protein YegP (UPF0339 family)
LKAANGEILATAGQGYKAKASCVASVERIQNGQKVLRFETYQHKPQDHRWRAKASNGQIVAASSEGYSAEAPCQKALDLIKKGAAKAAVDDQT